MGVLSKFTAMSAKLRLTKAQIKAIQAKESEKKAMHPNAPGRMIDTQNFFTQDIGANRGGGSLKIFIKTPRLDGPMSPDVSSIFTLSLSKFT